MKRSRHSTNDASGRATALLEVTPTGEGHLAAQDATPPGWARSSVGDVFKIVGGGTPSTSQPEFWIGPIPWITSADIDEHHHVSPHRTISEAAIENSATNLVPRGSVIVVTRVGLGKVGLAPADMCFSQDSQALLFDPAVLDPRYVVHYMGEAVSVFRHISRGTTINGVTKKQLAELPFLIAPLCEQQRIVAELEKQFTWLEAAVAALKRVQANLKRYRASVLKMACEGRLVPTEAELARAENRPYEPAGKLLARILKERRARWEADQLAKMHAAGKPPKDDKWKAKYKEPAPRDRSNLPHLPEGWAWASLSQLAEIQGGIQKQPSRKPVKNMCPFLRVANVMRGTLDLSEVHRIELFRGELDKLRLTKGDLLIVEGNGSPSEIGRMAMWRGEIQDCVHQNHIIRARLFEGTLPDFAESYWNSADGAGRVLNVASSTSGLHTLSVSKVGRLPVPLPPSAEQSRIVAEVERRLSVIDEMEATVEANLKRAAGLRQSILKRAFEGKLVPQDPADEPAAILLERIRAERAARARDGGRATVRSRVRIPSTMPK